MKKKNKKTRRQRARERRRHDDLHLAFGAVNDAAAWAQSVEIDAVADRKWLQEHPDASCRIRVASVREVRAFAVLPGTQVVVTRGPDGSQVRRFMPPRSAAAPNWFRSEN